MWRRVLLVSGIVASALYIGTDLLGAALSPGYSYADQTISELQAIGSHARGPMVGLSLIASMLMLQPAIVGRPLLVVAVALDLAPWLVIAAGLVVLRHLHRPPPWSMSTSPHPAL